MKRQILLLIFLLTFTNIIAQWSYIGLGAYQCSDLTIYNDTIYASTNDGIYKRSIYSTDTNWIPAGMQGQHVVQSLVPDYQHFISLVEIGSSYTTQIYKTVDGGQTFNLMNTDTSSTNNYMYLDGMDHPDGNYDTLYFLNHHLKTYDGGLSWDTIHNNLLTDRFIKVAPIDHNQLMIGGETWILAPYLQLSPNNGLNWSMPMMNNYFAGDNCVHDISFIGNDWYAAGEGVICKSTDGGDNWTQLLNMWGGGPIFSLYFWDIEYSGLWDFLYVTGSNSTATNVPLLLSADHGLNWDTIAIQPVVPGNPQMKALAVQHIFDGDLVYLGGHGVYTYQNQFNNVKYSERKKHFSIYPNPFQLTFTMNTDFSPSDFPLQLELVNVLGETVFTTEVNSKTTFLSPTLSPGIYLCRMKGRSGVFEKGEKLIKY